MAALSPGTRLGPYEVVEAIGSGGMGEVYRARDTKLGRDVAIKVLPEEYARDKERLDRFEREARLLAQLNHANIATLYGLEEHDGQKFLVMELVEGETLAERIAKGPIPIDEAVPLFIQIAEGLEAAHEKAIIHRDLKPANIKIGPDGKPKILDFGLAKAFSPEQDGSAESSQSPTLTRGTALGVIMGTAAYMSPEQARGKQVDKKTDIWAFGCCLYEALTARKTFDGDTVNDIISAVLRSEPQWDALTAATPASIQRLLRRCLVKELRKRIPDIGVARIELEEPSSEADSQLAPSARAWRRLVPYFATATTAALVAWSMKPGGGDTPTFLTRAVIELPGNELVQGTSSVALSADGQLLVYVAEVAGVSQLFSRPMNRFEETPIPGTEGARGPFFSPDGREVGFFTPDSLKKVLLVGGIPNVIADIRLGVSGAGGTWADDDTIIFSTGIESGLTRMSAGGGRPEILTAPDKDEGEIGHSHPQMLPGGEHVLFTIMMGGYSEVGLLSLRTREWHVLQVGQVGPVGRAQGARYTSSGHLVIGQSGGLSAAPFDLRQLKLSAPFVPIVRDVSMDPGSGRVDYALSANGTLVYVPEHATNRVVWVDRSGGTEPLLDASKVYLAPRLSSDERRLVVAIYDPSVTRRSIWLSDLERGTLTRLTAGDVDATDPVWSPDGTRIAYAQRTANTNLNLFVKNVDGTDEPIQLTDVLNAPPTSWSPDGGSIFHQGAVSIASNVSIVAVGAGNSVETLIDEARSGVLSPDGRWLAYTFLASDRAEVYVSSYPALDRKFLVSTDGGVEPRWSGNSRELFYRNGDKMMAVDIHADAEFSASKPKLLFEGRFAIDPIGGDAINYDVTADGQRFVMIREDERARKLHVVVNWLEELERLVPTEN